MRRIRICTALATLGMIVIATPAFAQSKSAEAKSNALAASFSKFKSVSKEKRGVKKEKYLKVESAPVALRNPADYSGKYQVPDLPIGLELNVNRDGTFTGTGYEPL
ncbi:MAG TPA: hypothetical protein VJ840_09135, partial [Gemmatimonadaceae bacterium]|nr:hypothetical protein [Gemmatimonadaceae bacterium]